MTWEQKLQALQALIGPLDTCLGMRHPGNWYVRQRGVEIGGDGMLTGPSVSGQTPEKAVEAYWNRLTELKPNFYIVTNAMSTTERRQVRWNGFMWEDVPK